MQISRLFKIVYLLQDRKHVTAKELAEYFEVSTRTILRDIDTLAEAGIPVYTTKGKGGGIFIMDRFILNKTTVSKEEQEQILFALQSLKLTEQVEEKELLTKLQTFFQNTSSGWIEVDFSRWGSDENEKEIFSLIKKSILRQKVLKFDYTSMTGETLRREVNPLRFVFKRNAWYLQGYCCQKEDYRTFKIYRMRNIEMTNAVFDPAEYEAPPLENFHAGWSGGQSLVLEFSKEIAYRVYDDFITAEIRQKDDGRFIVRTEVEDEPELYDYLLSMGPEVKVIEPDFIRENLLKRLEEIKNNYFS